MSSLKDLLEKMGEVIVNTDAVKVAVTLDMIISAAEFVEQAWDSFEGNEPTAEEQLALYEKYDEYFISQKQRMKQNIANAKAKAAAKAAST